MQGCRKAARTLAAIAVLCAWPALTPDADATITSVFTKTATPVPCAVQSNLVRLCDETAFTSPRARSTVRTYDGVPIDVRVAFPAQPAIGSDGPFPLIVLFSRYAGEKLTKQDTSAWQGRGFATLTMTDRGFGESCGTQASRDAEPSRCEHGYVRMMDTRYEVRDAQELIGRLVEDGVVDAQRIGAVGASYGGARAFALAALKDRKILRDNSIVSWKSPNGTRISLAAAAPRTAWTDLVAAFAPNGSTLDYVEDALYTGRSGVLKQSFENALYDSGLPFYYAPAGADPTADITGWHTLLNAGEPYEDSSGVLYSAIQDLRDELTTNHSSYYIDHSRPPAPLFITSGLTDDLTPADEAIRFYNRTRTQYPTAPISLFLASLGHSRAQDKQADAAAMRAREVAWMDYYVKGVGPQPFQGVETIPQTCPDSAPSGGPYYASDWAAVAPGEVRIDGGPSVDRISPTAGSSAIARIFDPLSGLGPCATASALDQAGAVTYRSAFVPEGGFTLMGSPTVVADITSPGRNSQIAARLLDVEPETTVETLVARGLWRPVVATGPVRQVFQMHPNAYRFAPGHIVKLELLPSDNPYGRVSNDQLEVALTNLQLRLPALEQPGSLNGLVQSPAPKVVPAGSRLARDFIPAEYPRPRGATPVHLALVPAFRQCTAPDSTHGAPLAFGSCKPPVQTSQALTFGTPDLNGKDARSAGSADFGVVAEDPLTPVAETDVRVALSLLDVRTAGTLADYEGELESRTSLRITDRASGGAGDEAATVVDTPLHATLPCMPTAAANEGAACGVLTSANALIPGAVRGGLRSVWELGRAEVYDGGADGYAATTADNRLLAGQGLFAR